MLDDRWWKRRSTTYRKAAPFSAAECHRQFSTACKEEMKGFQVMPSLCR
jgi:hypothetical protein